MTTELAMILAAIAAAAIVLAGIGVWWINRAPKSRHGSSDTIPLFTGLGASGTDIAPQARPVPAPREAPVPAASSRKRPAAVLPPDETEQAVAVPPNRPPPIIREFTTALAPAPTPSVPTVPRRAPDHETSVPADAPVVSDAGVPGTMVEGHAVRFSVPAEGTLQFLPGRLEIGTGVDAGREIRFVHVPGPDGTDVTFGRTDGALYRHIQLRDKTVSRQHAVLQWRESHWYLRNLSHTNPVAHNGAVLDTLDLPCLQDGDRIEMGEVIFTFRSR